MTKDSVEIVITGVAGLAAAVPATIAIYRSASQQNLQSRDESWLAGPVASAEVGNFPGTNGP
jgi:hypothetical protein